jgi:hypothetical protein
MPFNNYKVNFYIKKTSLTGPNVIKLFCPQFTDFRNKLECLFLASLSGLIFGGKAGA